MIYSCRAFLQLFLLRGCVCEESVHIRIPERVEHRDFKVNIYNNSSCRRCCSMTTIWNYNFQLNLHKLYHFPKPSSTHIYFSYFFFRFRVTIEFHIYACMLDAPIYSRFVWFSILNRPNRAYRNRVQFLLRLESLLFFCFCFMCHSWVAPARFMFDRFFFLISILRLSHMQFRTPFSRERPFNVTKHTARNSQWPISMVREAAKIFPILTNECWLLRCGSTRTREDIAKRNEFDMLGLVKALNHHHSEACRKWEEERVENCTIYVRTWCEFF